MILTFLLDKYICFILERAFIISPVSIDYRVNCSKLITLISISALIEITKFHRYHTPYSINWPTKVQFGLETVCTMTKSIRTKPLLMVSYVFGLRIVNLSNYSRWFSVLYMLLIWLLYYFLSTSALLFSFYEYYYDEDICFCLESFTTVCQSGRIYHDKIRS